MKLFCFPYAGGSSYIFSGWEKEFPETIRIIPIEYPGHGMYFNQCLHDSVHSLVNELYSQIVTQINDEPYCFYGHSLGSIICFELTRKLNESAHSLPNQLIISGSVGPQFKEQEKFSELGDDLFLTQIQNKYNGFISALKDNEEILQLFLPILKADFYMSENYVFLPKDKLNCPISVIHSLDDDLLTHNELMGWAAHTIHNLRVLKIPGDHFSLFRERQHKNLLIKHISNLCITSNNSLGF